MDIITFTEQNLAIFLLIAARISGIFVAAPIFSSRNIPPRIRALLTIFISIVIFQSLAQSHPADIPNQLLPFILSVAMEFIIGASIGLILDIFFAIMQVGGQMMDTQVGFGIVNVVDPQSGVQLPLLGNFLQMLFTIVFFVSDLHHVFLLALINSFEIIPLNGGSLQPQSATFIAELFVSMFSLALRIAMPLIMTTLLVDISMGMLARTMPQMNVFVVGIPLKLAVGIFVLSIFLPTYIYVIKVVYGGVSANVYKLLSTFVG